MVTFAAIMVFMLENQTNRSDYRKMNESTNELNDLKLKPAVKFVCLLWYVKHLLIWSLISNIYKFILIYIIMIVFSCAKSLLVSLRSMYWLPGLLQMFRHLGELGRVSTWGGRKNEQEGRCLSQVKCISSPGGCVLCVTAAGAVLGPSVCGWRGGRAAWGSQPCLLPQDRDVLPCRDRGVRRSQSNPCMSLAIGRNKSRRRPDLCQAGELRLQCSASLQTSCVCSQRSVSPGLSKVKFLRVSFPFSSLLFLISLMLWKDIILNITHALPPLSLDILRDPRTDFKTWEDGNSLYYALKRHVQKEKDVNLEVSLVK